MFIHVPNPGQGNYPFWTSIWPSRDSFTQPNLTQLWISSNINIPTKYKAEGNISTFLEWSRLTPSFMSIRAHQHTAHCAMHHSQVHYSGGTKARLHCYFILPSRLPAKILFFFFWRSQISLFNVLMTSRLRVAWLAGH